MQLVPAGLGDTLSRRAGEIGEKVAGVAAAEVDRDARFPAEAIAALRAESLLSVLVPTDLGGLGATVGQVADMVFELGQHCASTAMVFAMHQIQVASIVHHGGSAFFGNYLSELAERQLLLASATTELGVGGDVRTSVCTVERDEDGMIHLEKMAPVISYGEYADGILATARREPASPPNDQVLVLCRQPGLTLEPISGWDTLGFRGTCSLGYRLVAPRRGRTHSGRSLRRDLEPHHAAGLTYLVEFRLARACDVGGREGEALRTDGGPPEARRHASVSPASRRARRRTAADGGACQGHGTVLRRDLP